MIHNLSRKLFGIAVFSGIAIYALFAFSLHLGLDLRGGARIVYSFDFDSALESNQIDETEYNNKSQMVSQMADIFPNASTAVAWLIFQFTRRVKHNWLSSCQTAAKTKSQK